MYAMRTPKLLMITDSVCPVFAEIKQEIPKIKEDNHNEKI